MANLLKIPGLATKLGYHLVANLTEVPVVPGAFYAIDLDDTIFSTKKVFDRQAYLNKPSKTARGYMKEVTVLHHSDNSHWLKSVATCADLVYITMRSPDLTELTQADLRNFDLPLKPVYFSQHKGKTFSEVLASLSGPAGRHYFKELIFVDDLHSNISEVLDYLPQCKCYRVDAKLATKLQHRQQRKDAAIAKLVKDQ